MAVLKRHCEGYKKRQRFTVISQDQNQSHQTTVIFLVLYARQNFFLFNMSTAQQLDGANRPDAYGLDAELAAKKAAKRDPKAEEDARVWISAVTGKPVEGNLQQALRDGVILCELMNVLRPGSVPKINTGKMPFLLMENINNFLAGCRAMGVADGDLFMTVDLYEDQNFNQVVGCITALGRRAAAQGFNGPTLGPKEASANRREFTEEQMRAGEFVVPKQTAGSHGNATQAGMHDMSRNIVKLPNERDGRSGPATGKPVF